MLIRYDSKDQERIREVIERGRSDWTAAKPPPRPRKRK